MCAYKAQNNGGHEKIRFYNYETCKNEENNNETSTKHRKCIKPLHTANDKQMLFLKCRKLKYFF